MQTRISTPQLRHLRRAATITTTILLAIVIAGCYWTPPEDEGSINISLSDNDVATNRITASATDEGVDALLEVYVISESVLRGDQSAVDDAFADLDQQFLQAEEDFTADPTSFDPENYDLSIDLPQFQFQAGFLAVGADGIEGQSRFGGLRAGEGYLVLVNLWGLETYVDAIAFDSVDIEAGETTTVNLQLDDSEDAWMAYVEFLTENYGYGEDDENEFSDDPLLSYSDISINTTLPSDGVLEATPSQLYYDIVVLPDGAEIPVGEYIYGDSEPSEPPFSLWDEPNPDSQLVGLPDMTVGLAELETLILPDGTPILDGSTGSRTPLSGTIENTGLIDGTMVQVVVTDVENRGMPKQNLEEFPQVLGISEPFQVGENPQDVSLYEWNTAGSQL